MIGLGSELVSNTPWKLPGTVIPTRYTLALRPNVEKLTVEGHVDISIQFKKETHNITLNSKELDLYNVKLVDNTPFKPIYFNATDVRYNINSSMVSIFFGDAIRAGNNLTLSIDFRGIISKNEPVGFYSSTQPSDNHSNQVFLSTHFEPSYARRAFPCWDEPKYKTNFDIILDVPNYLTALSNSEVLKVEEIADLKRYYFKTTPLMPVYTLAFAIGDMEYIEEAATGYNRTQPIICRLYTIRGLSSKTHDSLTAMVQSLNFFEDYFQMSSRLTKLDLLAVPKLIPAAMKNWGLITMRQESLVMDSAHLDQRKLEFSRMIIAHELAHQWFGNLVTMKSWNDLWLNEAFATYFEAVAGKHIYPHFDLHQWLYRNYIGSFLKKNHNQLDSINPTEEIEMTDLSDISPVVYSKGATMLSILKGMLSEAKFRKTIQGYLRQHQLKNVQSADLYNAISKYSNFNIHRGDILILNISQVPFIKEEPQPIWYIPIDITFNTSRSGKCSLKLKDPFYTIPIPTGTHYKLEPSGFGLIKVDYPDRIFNDIASISSEVYNKKDQLELVESSNYFIESELRSPTLMLDLLRGFKNLKDVELITKIQDITYSFILNWASVSKFRSFYNQIERQWYQNFNSSLDWTDATQWTQFERDIIAFSAKSGNSTILQSANKVFDKFITGNRSVISNSKRLTLFKTVLTQEGLSYVRVLLPLIDSDIDLSDYIIASLSYCHPTHLPVVLDWVNKQSPYNLTTLLDGAPLGREYPLLVWESIKARWTALTTEQKNDLPGLMSGILSRLLLPEDTKPILDFITKNPFPYKSMVIDTYISQYRINLRDFPLMMKNLDRYSTIPNDHLE